MMMASGGRDRSAPAALAGYYMAALAVNTDA
jgi:hypothetical protein